MTKPGRIRRAWTVLRTGADPVPVRVSIQRPPEPRDCFHWQDANEDEPPIGVPVIGMWIDSDGSTSTLPVTYGYDHEDAGPLPTWTYDGMTCRTPHAWCANLDAH